jgi:hypothetical protein
MQTLIKLVVLGYVVYLIREMIISSGIARKPVSNAKGQIHNPQLEVEPAGT